MTNIIRFDVEGIPRAKQSFRYYPHGKYQGFTSPLTRAWQDMVTARAKEAMAANGWNKIKGPIHVRLEFCLLSKRRVDCDNLGKAVADGLRHVCFTDDSQITVLEISKQMVDYFTGVEVTVYSTEHGRELFLK